MTTRKTYELPAPTTRTSRGTFATWRTGHAIEIDGELADDGHVSFNRSRGNIFIETHNNDVLALDYNEARRVALALLAAVEEVETMKGAENGRD
ncbi:hypothetical protein ACN4DY_07515 [Corynebacterium macclintockiae]|uniref:hypothetical protein n=1 Tax=Corynebacterium macclintockiae TaxID=2913501 RepID=UPI003EB79EE4